MAKTKPVSVNHEEGDTHVIEENERNAYNQQQEELKETLYKKVSSRRLTKKQVKSLEVYRSLHMGDFIWFPENSKYYEEEATVPCVVGYGLNEKTKAPGVFISSWDNDETIDHVSAFELNDCEISRTPF